MQTAQGVHLIGPPTPVNLGSPLRMVRPGSPMEVRQGKAASSTAIDARQPMQQWRHNAAPRPGLEPPGEDHVLRRRQLGQSAAGSPSLLCPSLIVDVEVSAAGPSMEIHGSGSAGPSPKGTPSQVALGQVQQRDPSISLLSEKLHEAELRLATLKERAVDQKKALALEQKAAQVTERLQAEETQLDALGQRERVLKTEEASAMRDIAVSGVVPGCGPLAEQLGARNRALQMRVDELEEECVSLKQACVNAHEQAAEKAQEMKDALAQELAMNDTQLTLCEEEVATYGRSGDELRQECRKEIEQLRGQLTTAEEEAWKEAAEAEHWAREAAQVKQSIEGERRQLLAQLDFVQHRVLQTRQESKKLEMEQDEAKADLHKVQQSIQQSRDLIAVAQDECTQAAQESRQAQNESAELEMQQAQLEEQWHAISRDGARRIATLQGEAQDLRQTIRNAENGFLERSDGRALIDGTLGRQELLEFDRQIQNSQQGLNAALAQLQHQGSELRDWHHRCESGAEPEPEGGATPGEIPANALQEELQRSRQELEVLQEHAAQCRAEASTADATAAAARGDLSLLESQNLRSKKSIGTHNVAARERQLEAEVQLVRDQLEFAAMEQARVQKDLHIAMSRLGATRANSSHHRSSGTQMLPPPERVN
eukprot:gnl/MRDRNA2_/MRDRNA2_100445_c0_seq1.p1 gnl/MRDRNA2_/MRDRNA2_100445_c0~~gnl/MRDRNA2_/MRDRNA2_100445_c0_seq1.p1  ORF type:complete len:654 (-),score=180.97 gnl/MRDRNA2_/MRDRNA2_100445_c0_seq1:225-2186(-)